MLFLQFCISLLPRHILRLISNSAEKLGLFFFWGGSDGPVARVRGPGNGGREGLDGRTGAAGRTAGPASDRENAKPGGARAAGPAETPRAETPRAETAPA